MAEVKVNRYGKYYKATQVWVRDALPPSELPKLPNMYEALIECNRPPEVVEKIKTGGRPRLTEWDRGWRSKKEGNGVCKVCLKHKTAEEFKTRTGLICKDCS